MNCWKCEWNVYVILTENRLLPGFMWQKLANTTVACQHCRTWKQHQANGKGGVNLADEEKKDIQIQRSVTDQMAYRQKSIVCDNKAGYITNPSVTNQRETVSFFQRRDRLSTACNIGRELPTALLHWMHLSCSLKFSMSSSSGPCLTLCKTHHRWMTLNLSKTYMWHHPIRRIIRNCFVWMQKKNLNGFTICPIMLQSSLLIYGLF